MARVARGWQGDALFATLASFFGPLARGRLVARVVARGRFVCQPGKGGWQGDALFATLASFFAGVLVYIPGGRRPPRDRIITECKPNPSLPGFWFTLPAAAGR